MEASNLGEALRLASLGYPVFPCVPGDRKPLNLNGCFGATVDRDTITEWWTQTPDANIGLSTNGLCVVVVDPMKDGSPNPWLPDVIDGLEDPPKSQTPRGGIHLVYSAPVWSKLRSSTNKLADCVDTRADGGYICVAPSCTANGEYKWMKDLPPRYDLPRLPQWLFDQLAVNKPGKSKTVKEQNVEPNDWPAVQPLPNGLHPVEPFDPLMLPDAFRDWLADVSERMQTPLDFAAVGAVIALAGVVGRKICIRPKQYDDWEVIPNLWGAIIGRPGLLKSPVLQEVTRPLRRLEAEARKRFFENVTRFEIQHAAWKRRERQRQQKLDRDIDDENAVVVDNGDHAGDENDFNLF